ncbi:MAG: hypothetical protein RR869_04945 [Lachnospiraceae bacterium]
MRRWKKAVLCMLCISALGQMAACTTSKNDGMLDDTTTMDGKTNGQ